MLTRESAAASLASIAAHLLALQTTYHALHVSASGTDFYSDHLLFQRLYEDDDLDAAIDDLLERAQLLNPARIIDPHQLFRAALSFTPELTNMPPRERQKAVQMMESSLQSSISGFLQDLHAATDAITGRLAVGVENLLQGIADQRQTVLYLLTRRFKD